MKPRFWRQFKGHTGCRRYLLLLALVTLTYSAGPIAQSWAQMVETDAGSLTKGRPFKESSLVVAAWALNAAIGLVLSATFGGVTALRQCFSKRAIFMFSPAGAGWALADVCEVLAVTRIDAASYGIISQTRLIGTGLLRYYMHGVRQTKSQWCVLGALSLACMSYCLIPDASGPTKRVLSCAGVMLSFGKVSLSVISGVYGETCFKQISSSDGAPPELHVQMVQISLSSLLFALAGYVSVCCLNGESPRDFFSGPDGSWDARTVTVALLFSWREWLCNMCVKRFDSLVKNICNAMSLVVTYTYVVQTGESQFSALKAFMLVAVVVEVVHYSAIKLRLSPGAEDALKSKAASGIEDFPVEAYKALGCVSRTSTPSTGPRSPSSSETFLTSP